MVPSCMLALLIDACVTCLDRLIRPSELIRDKFPNCNVSVYPCTQKESLGQYVHTTRPLYEISGDPNDLTYQSVYVQYM